MANLDGTGVRRLTSHPGIESGPRFSPDGSTIAFTGKTSGLVLFYASIDTAKQITASMLGMEPSAVGDEMHDAIGELTNMIAGSFRTLDDQPRSGIAAFDTGGNLLPWNPIGPDDNVGQFNVVVHDGGVVYAIGNFSALGGLERPGVAAFDDETGALTPWTPETSGVGDLAVVDGGIVRRYKYVRGDGAGGHGEQHDPELAFAQRVPFFHDRDVDHPARQHKAVDEEDDGEAEPEAGTTGRALAELLEHVGEYFRLDAAARIYNAQVGGASGGLQVDVDGPARVRELDRVRDEVDDDLVEPGGVAEHGGRWQLRRAALEGLVRLAELARTKGDLDWHRQLAAKHLGLAVRIGTNPDEHAWVQGRALRLALALSFDLGVDLLTRRLVDPTGGSRTDFLVRRLCVELLGASQDDRTLALLRDVEHRGDPSVHVRQGVAEALAKRGELAGLHRLAGLDPNAPEPSPKVRATAIQAACTAATTPEAAAVATGFVIGVLGPTIPHDAGGNEAPVLDCRRDEIGEGRRRAQLVDLPDVSLGADADFKHHLARADRHCWRRFGDSDRRHARRFILRRTGLNGHREDEGECW